MNLKLVNNEFGELDINIDIMYKTLGEYFKSIENKIIMEANF
ncbi:MAG: hypothetical protein ACNI3H_06215 [Halarcobacter ebronensis]